MKEISIRNLAEIHRISDVKLGQYANQGVDIWDSRAVIKKLWTQRVKPPEWTALFDELTAEDESSHEYWKKEETKEKVNKLRLQNSLIEGEQFKREDVDAATMALGSAFKLALMEAKSVLPPQLVGLTEAEIEKLLDGVFRRTLENMSDLSSSTWTQIKEKYARGEDAGQDSGSGSTGDASKPGSDGKSVVPRKRKAGSRTRPEP
jgi:hypothetical protein